MATASALFPCSILHLQSSFPRLPVPYVKEPPDRSIRRSVCKMRSGERAGDIFIRKAGGQEWKVEFYRDGALETPPGFGVRQSPAAFDRFMTCKAAEDCRTPRRCRAELRVPHFNCHTLRPLWTKNPVSRNTCNCWRILSWICRLPGQRFSSSC